MLARHSDSAGPTSRASWCRSIRPGNYSNYLSRHFCSIKNYDNLLLIAVTRIWLVEIANLTNGMSELLCEVKVTQNERQVKRAMRYHSKTILENDCTKFETGLCQIWVMSVEMITYVQKVPRRNKTLNQRWFNVGPLSTTLDHWFNVLCVLQNIRMNAFNLQCAKLTTGGEDEKQPDEDNIPAAYRISRNTSVPGKVARRRGLNLLSAVICSSLASICRRATQFVRFAWKSKILYVTKINSVNLLFIMFMDKKWRCEILKLRIVFLWLTYCAEITVDPWWT